MHKKECAKEGAFVVHASAQRVARIVHAMRRHLC
jgi:hypothetical protein